MIKKLRIIVLFSFVLVTVCFLALNNNKVKAKEEELQDTSEFFIDSSLFTHMDDETAYNQGAVDLSDFDSKLENSHLELFYNKANGAIRILNKDTSYVWASDILNIDDNRKEVIYTLIRCICGRYCSKTYRFC